MLRKIPLLFRNFYTLTAVGFLLWMTFLDGNDFISRHEMNSRLRSLEQEREFYKEKIRDIQKDKDALMGDPELLEKYAREEYLMKKESEDVFIIVEE